MVDFCVYILRCSNRSLYVGYTRNIDKRLKIHNPSSAPCFTRKRRPVTLAYSEDFTSEQEAINREKQLKKWTRAKKEALIAGNIASLKSLSKRRF